ncbi:unnamed protein product [Prunus armeniaca]|uniref:CCT domain-containing protein n=1 Tax=Prunus armeniaca TaxID=36596 RepID=A0A6J5V1L7_PRUAR|nr:unnamed protein product [Prunus armeniaca]
MITEKKANAMGGNTARACDSCLIKRARWFCAADDAFLCQRCDGSVHSANQLASRHERVKLQAASSKPNQSTLLAADQSPPAWHKGFTRKARTPRHNNKPPFMAKDDKEKVSLNPPLPFVPEIGCEEANYMDDDEENEDLEQLLYRVPIYDPFAAELCNMSSHEVGNSTSAINLDDEVTEMGRGNHHEVGDDEEENNNNNYGGNELDNLPGFLPSDMELAEFAADVENLIGGGLDDEDSGDIKGVLGLLDDSKLEGDGGVDVCMKNVDINEDRKAVKVEEEAEGMEFNPSMLDWNSDYELRLSSSPLPMGGEEEEKVVFLMGAQSSDEVALMDNKQMMMKRKICLRLDYEAIITAWANQGSPWTTGTRPELNPDDGWLDCMGMWGSDQIHQSHGHGESAGCVGGRGDDRGREARVSRYREKRRTRLFSKKIRYEVRKLNAEKRPRMKGRFVKRTSGSNFVGSSSSNSSKTAAAAFPYLIHQ